MNDTLNLYIVLAALYVLECIVKVNYSSIIFIQAKKWWSYSSFDKWYHVKENVFYVTNPFTPWRKALILSKDSIFFSPQGLFVPSISFFIKYNDIKSVSIENNKLFINSKMRLRCNNHEETIQYKETITSIAMSDYLNRENLIYEFIKKRISHASLLKRLSQVDNYPFLKIHTILLFISIFLCVPILVLTKGLASTWYIIASAILSQNIIISILYYRLHKKIYLYQKSERIVTALTILFYPPAAINAYRTLTRNLAGETCAAIAAVYLLNEKMSAALVSKYLRELKYILNENKTDQQYSVLRWYSEKLIPEISRIITKKYPYLELYKKPVPENELMSSYCPRCLTQYVKNSKTCSDCGIKLDDL